MKELPYFKFIVSEWNDGDITICSFEAQGLFINLCSLYWSQAGTLSITKCKRRYNGCNTAVWDELINEGIIKVKGDQIFIDFLDKQLIERKKLSAINSENVRKRWEKEQIDTTVLPPNNDGIASVYNIEEKRREEKREENISFDFFWDKYNKRVGKDKTKKLWNKIDDAERVKIITHLDTYLKVEKMFRKDPERYLKNKTWNDEVILNSHDNLPKFL